MLDVCNRKTNFDSNVRSKREFQIQCGTPYLKVQEASWREPKLFHKHEKLKFLFNKTGVACQAIPFAGRYHFTRRFRSVVNRVWLLSLMRKSTAPSKRASNCTVKG